MNAHSSAQVPLGLAAEPPVSLPSEEGPQLHAAPEPQAPATPLRPPLEAQLVQQGKLSMGQLAQAHRDRLEKGGSVLDIVVERGWVSGEDVVALRAEHAVETSTPAPAPMPAPAPVVAAEPEPKVEPVPEVAPAPAPAPVAESPAPVLEATRSDETPFTIAIRLTTGELIVAGQTEGADKAEALAQAVVADLATQGDSWPSFGGRYLRPETIVSVDIVPA
jgi:hypothetical protein